MKAVKIIAYSVASLLVVAVLFLLWYKATYSMGIAESYEINDPSLHRRVLIATQESKFKKELVNAVVTQVKDLPVYVRVIDVSELNGVDPKIWSVIVILHTWEMGEPQKDAEAFFASVPHNKLIVVTTSGDGGNKLDKVDGISSASHLSDVSRCSDMIVQRIHALTE